MNDARDAEDTRLLQAGEHRLLIDSYIGVIYDRCRLKLRGSLDAEDVAHEVVFRLMRELKRGKTYDAPFRVVVHKVIDWKVSEYFQAVSYEAELEEWMAGVTDGSGSTWEAAAGFDALLEGLTELEQQVVRWRYNDDLDFQEIAARLGKEPNAVHQIHFRALDKLRRGKT